MSSQAKDYLTLGLTSAQAEASRREHGSNVLTPPQRPSAWKLYLEKFRDPIIRILLLAAVLSLIIGVVNHEFVETVGIVAAIVLATSIGFYFEYDAQRRFQALSRMGREEPATVVRDGRVTRLSRGEVVVGDIVLVGQGEEVPADGELLDSVNLVVDESSLTGEMSCPKSADPTSVGGEPTFPANRLLRSSMLLDGHGVMRVDCVGDATEIGRVARQAAAETDVVTPLNAQLSRLAKVINRWAIGISLAVFIICSVHGLLNYFSAYHEATENLTLGVAQIVLKNFMLAVTLIVMAVPEGLPMAVTLSLALNMRRMLKTNNLVRRMHACETMGAITVVCTDKTGTLTQNRMTVAELQHDAADEPLLIENMAVNATAHIEQAPDEMGMGNPTECALLRHLRRMGHEYLPIRSAVPLISQLSFSTERKYMATLVESQVSGDRVLHVKGAPEVVLARCVMDEAKRASVKTLLERFQASAMRTLAFASKTVSQAEGDDCQALAETGGLTLTGLCAITDPVREEVPAAVQRCLDAGIQVKIVTGDATGTTLEIARRIGLWSDADSDSSQITGPAFAALSDEEALRRAGDIKVMSRARPGDKQRLVQLLQQSGEVVAVTGDGTNDAPALNFAHVGLSMGSGSAVAKEASDITLIDDSFGSIATAVMWGRSLYKNIQRFIGFQLTISLTALIITLLSSLIGVEMPLTVTQILWINLIIDTFASLALSTIPPTPAVMNEKPRRQTDFIVSNSVVRNVFLSTLLFSVVMLGLTMAFDTPWLLNDAPVTPTQLTIIFTVFVMLQFWNLLNAKAWQSGCSAFSGLCRCRGLLVVLGIILVGQILIVTFGGEVFRTVPLSPLLWLAIIALTSLTLWGGELIRFFTARHEPS